MWYAKSCFAIFSVCVCNVIDILVNRSAARYAQQHRCRLQQQVCASQSNDCCPSRLFYSHLRRVCDAYDISVRSFPRRAFPINEKFKCSLVDQLRLLVAEKHKQKKKKKNLPNDDADNHVCDTSSR